MTASKTPLASEPSPSMAVTVASAPRASDRSGGRLLGSFSLACAIASFGCAAAPPPPVQASSSPPVPKIVSGALDARVVLGDTPGKAVRLGAGPGRVLVAGEVVEGERGGAFVELNGDTCLLSYARGSSTVEDLDLAIFAEEGHPLAADERPDAQPTVMLCPPVPKRVYVAVHAASGQGLLAVAVHLVPREKAADVARGLSARGRSADGPRPAEAWPGLDERVRAHRADLGGKWEELRRVALPVDARVTTTVALPVDEASCVDALVVPEDEVGPIDAEATDDAGRVLGRARDGSRTRTLTLCSPIAMSGTLSIRPHTGSGNVAVVLSRARAEVARDVATRTTVAWAATSLPLDAARGARERELAKAAYGPASATSSGVLALGRRAIVPLRLPTQTGCNRIDVVAGAPLALIEANVWDGTHLLSGGEGAGALTVFVCGRAKADLELETRGRPGPFSVLTRAETWQSPVFMKFPLASSRMLTRATSGASALHEGRAISVRQLHLDPSGRDFSNREIAGGQCLRVAAGSEGSGTGLEMRIFDVKTGDELDRSGAEHGASVRACAEPDQPREVRIESRVTSGALDVVVGERTVGSAP